MHIGDSIAILIYLCTVNRVPDNWYPGKDAGLLLRVATNHRHVRARLCI